MILQLLAVTLAVAQFAPAVQGVPAEVTAVVEEHMAARHIPGLSLAIGVKGKIYTQGFGLADLEHRVPVTPATVFGVQSTQKLLTAAAMLRLVQAGRLGLDDLVQRHCPAYGTRRWPVTLRALLSHQGGLRSSDLRDLFNRDHYDSPEAALRRFARDSLQYQPGMRTGYSNAGYTLLACAIEGITGLTYDSALATLVLRPAGMTSTRADNVFEVIPSKTRYYIVRTAANTEQWQGLWTVTHLSATRLDQPANADPVDPSWAIGAGSYLGTPVDLVRFALALVDGRLLRDGYVDSALAQVTLTGTGEPTGRTLGGWVVDTAGGGTVQVLGSSWNGSFGLAVVPATGVAVAVASNIEFDQPAELIARILDVAGSRR
jgi:CubicO group peptidase (beta-lactamase class C family)